LSSVVSGKNFLPSGRKHQHLWLNIGILTYHNMKNRRLIRVLVENMATRRHGTIFALVYPESIVLNSEELSCYRSQRIKF
jgi:hypothetical protein